MKPQSDSEVLRELRLQIRDLEPKVPEKQAMLKAKQENLKKLQAQLGERKVKIEAIKAKIERQNNKQARISESLQKNKLTYQQLLEKTKDDEQQAAEAIAQLDPANIEKRSHSHPEPVLFGALKAVMIMLGKSIQWDDISLEMQKPNLFIKQLQEIDKKNISEEVIREIDKYTNQMQPDLEAVRAKSLTAYYLWIWVHSVENYHEIYKGIKPWNQKLLRTKTGSVSLIEQNEKWAGCEFWKLNLCLE